MTFNIRYDEESDGAHQWTNRRDAVVDTIHAHAPDLLGLQEQACEQRDQIALALPDMTPLETGFCRSSRFDLVEQGVFAISEAGARTCSWARLSDRSSGRELLFANAHLDTTERVWLPSARVLLARLLGESRSAPIVLVGDFNCAAGSEAHRHLLTGGFRDAWYETGHHDEGVVTYHGFAGIKQLPHAAELERFLEETSPSGGEFSHYQAHVRRHANYRIDWILLHGPLASESAFIDTRRGRDGVLPSDHYPIVASVAWQ